LAWRLACFLESLITLVFNAPLPEPELVVPPLPGARRALVVVVPLVVALPERVSLDVDECEVVVVPSLVVLDLLAADAVVSSSFFVAEGAEAPFAFLELLSGTFVDEEEEEEEDDDDVFPVDDELMLPLIVMREDSRAVVVSPARALSLAGTAREEDDAVRDATGLLGSLVFLDEEEVVVCAVAAAEAPAASRSRSRDGVAPGVVALEEGRVAMYRDWTVLTAQRNKTKTGDVGCAAMHLWGGRRGGGEEWCTLPLLPAHGDVVDARNVGQGRVEPGDIRRMLRRHKRLVLEEREVVIFLQHAVIRHVSHFVFCSAGTLRRSSKIRLCWRLWSILVSRLFCLA
jgi:hypothetical protein